MAKEITATTNDVKITKRVITAPPTPQQVRIYHKADGSFQDVFPVDAKEIVAQGEYSFDDPGAVLHTESPNVYKPVRPETLSAILPEAREPLDERENRLAEGDEDDSHPLRGPLADDFPSRAALDAAGYGTYAKVRKLVAKDEGWYKDVPNIGERSFSAVEDALKEK